MITFVLPRILGESEIYPLCLKRKCIFISLGTTPDSKWSLYSIDTNNKGLEHNIDKCCFRCRCSGNFKAIIGSHSSVKYFYAGLPEFSGAPL